jgi:hypothetical protein
LALSAVKHSESSIKAMPVGWRPLIVEAVSHVAGHRNLIEIQVANVSPKWSRLVACSRSYAFDAAAPYVARRDKRSDIVEVSTVAGDLSSPGSVAAVTVIASRSVDDLLGGLDAQIRQLSDRVRAAEDSAAYLQASAQLHGKKMTDHFMEHARSAVNGRFEALYETLRQAFPAAETEYQLQLHHLLAESISARHSGDTKTPLENGELPSHWERPGLNRAKFDLFLEIVKRSPPAPFLTEYAHAGARVRILDELRAAVESYEAGRAQRAWLPPKCEPSD